MDPAIHAKLFNAVTEFDRKQAKKLFYNRYALGHYCAALERVNEAMDAGASLREAILANFLGRLLSAVLKAAGEPDFTIDEKRGQNFTR